MKNLLFISILFLSFGCCKEEPTPLYCTEDVELGTYVSDFTLPYEDAEAQIAYLNTDEATLTVTVNHPSIMSQLRVSVLKNKSFTSDCEKLQSVQRYSWETKEKNTLLMFGYGINNPPIIDIKEKLNMDEAHPNLGAVGQYLEFYETDAWSGALKTEPFMVLMVKEMKEGKGAVYEKNYSFFENIVIGGENYNNVYTNTEEAMGRVKHIYYQVDNGLVGFKDQDGVVWRIPN